MQGRGDRAQRIPSLHGGGRVDRSFVLCLLCNASQVPMLYTICHYVAPSAAGAQRQALLPFQTSFAKATCFGLDAMRWRRRRPWWFCAPGWQRFTTSGTHWFRVRGAHPLSRRAAVTKRCTSRANARTCMMAAAESVSRLSTCHASDRRRRPGRFHNRRLCLRHGTKSLGQRYKYVLEVQ